MRVCQQKEEEKKAFDVSDDVLNQSLNYCQARLLSLIAATNTSHVVFLSGDVHLAELTAMGCEELPYRFLDLTSSGMTHSVSDEYAPTYIRALFPGVQRVGPLHLKRNVAEIDIEWEADVEESILTMRVFDGKFHIVLEHSVRLKELLISAEYKSSDTVRGCADSPFGAPLTESCRILLNSCAKKASLLRGWLTVLLGIFVRLSKVFPALLALSSLLMMPFLGSQERLEAWFRILVAELVFVAFWGYQHSGI